MRDADANAVMLKLLEFIAEKRQEQKAIEQGDIVKVCLILVGAPREVRRKAVELWPWWLASRKELGHPSDVWSWYDSGKLYAKHEGYYKRYMCGTFLGNFMLRDDLDADLREEVIHEFCALGEGWLEDEGYSLDYWVMQWLARRWPTTQKFVMDAVMFIVELADPSQALELFKRASPTSRETIDRAYTEDGRNMDVVRWIYWKCWERLRECPEKLTSDQRLSLLRCVSGEEDERLVLDAICKYDLVPPIKESDDRQWARNVLLALHYVDNVRRMFEHVGRGSMDRYFRECRQCPEEIKALLTLAS